MVSRGKTEMIHVWRQKKNESVKNKEMIKDDPVFTFFLMMMYEREKNGLLFTFALTIKVCLR